MLNMCGISAIWLVTSLFTIVSLQASAAEKHGWRCSTHGMGGVRIPKAERTLLQKQCAPRIGPVLFHALIKGESAWNPYAINVNKCAMLFNGIPVTKASAVDLVQRILDAAPRASIDIGPGQVNSRNLPRLGLTVEQAMDTCTNLRAAETVLVDWCYEPALRRYGEGERAVNAAISCYNTGGFTRGGNYVRAVYRNAMQTGVVE